MRVYIEDPSPKELRAFEAWAKERYGIVQQVELAQVDDGRKDRILNGICPALGELDWDDPLKDGLDTAASLLARSSVGGPSSSYYFAEVESL